ncbi:MULTISPECIES: NAD(P)H-dependent oxidoreductase [unclassified Pseudoalteromonas]|uniref:FMN-dependent NADH-azoreductase n=1 Tax=unclassified Pseudoalteromonas TaxID=194690 RepID=UPI0020972C24|nr:NAD(P)H-dependent oxidoreductase [Pseudoalteromonas sp. XMcav2-N]MCO7187189.1 NAD(P)H-dependent oxidoreductase [Pseudoalteromonas sp. XMcav2-N]
MPTILRLDSSPRDNSSHSRAVADAVEQSLISNSEDWSVIRRDLSTQHIDVISQETIEGFYAAKESLPQNLKKAIALSDELIAELAEAETLIISAPIYNFSIPSSLKAWIDQIVRVNETFAFDGDSFNGLAKTKRAILALSYGATGYTQGGELSDMNFFEPYLVSLLKFIGINELEVFRIEGTSILDSDQLAVAKAELYSQINKTLKGGNKNV